MVGQLGYEQCKGSVRIIQIFALRTISEKRDEHSLHIFRLREDGKQSGPKFFMEEAANG